MKKRALLVAIRDYGKPALEVEAAVDEMARWSDLLVSPMYQFTDVQLLANEDANRDDVLAGLAELLSGTKVDDQVLFGFFGHGCLTAVPGTQQSQPTLLVRPGRDGKETISNLDLRDVVKAAHPVRGTDFTMIVDACFSGNLDVPRGDLNRAKPLRVTGVDAEVDRIFTAAFPNPPGTREPELLPAGFIQELGVWPDEDEDDTAFERPLILAASEPNQLAFQLTIDGVPRLLFSMRAQEELWKRWTPPTFRELINTINPLRQGFRQKATIVGNKDREGELFPGGNPVAMDNPPISVRSLAVTAESSLNVRVDGICCWLKGRIDDAFRRRLVLPHDPRTDEHHHIAFVEIANDDIDQVDGPPTAEYLHRDCMPGSEGCEAKFGRVIYSRWDLSGHRISITTTATSPPLSLTPAFIRHVPQMKKVLPDLRSTADDDCYSADPSPSRVAGLLDLSVGTVDIGTLEECHTAFEPLRDWPPNNREPEFTVLRLPITSANIKISLNPFAGSSGSDIEIILKPGTAWIRIGNEQLLDITGPGSGETPSEFFELFYNLSDQTTLDGIARPLPVPRKSLAPLNACTNSSWP